MGERGAAYIEWDAIHAAHVAGSGHELKGGVRIDELRMAHAVAMRSTCTRSRVM